MPLPISVPNSISVFKDTPHFTNTISSFSYRLRILYEGINTAGKLYKDLNIYNTSPYINI